MRSHSSRTRRFVPRSEGLERRQCLSVTIQANGPELRIDGGDAADTVSISDNGQGQVVVTANGRTATYKGISQIVVQTRGGNDSVNYTLTGSPSAESRLRIDLGNGADTASLRANGVRLGQDVEVEVNGGSGGDRITADYLVEVDKQFRFRLNGGDGNDTVTAGIVLLADSTGDVEARVKGNNGDDRLTLNVTGKAKSLRAELDGDEGFDRCAHTSNVEESECEAPL